MTRLSVNRFDRCLDGPMGTPPLMRQNDVFTDCARKEYHERSLRGFRLNVYPPIFQ
jgi:hypothetical protein